MGGGCFLQPKKWKIGGVLVKKWTFPQRRVHYVQYQYFYFAFYLFAANAPPPTGLLQSWLSFFSPGGGWAVSEAYSASPDRFAKFVGRTKKE